MGRFLWQEQTRALKAEDRARRLAIEHESRVSKLEQKLAQLSDLASNYDKYRQDDQQTIMKLKVYTSLCIPVSCRSHWTRLYF